MPKYRVTGPDGHTYDVTAPDGASQADIMKFAQGQVQPAARLASKLPPAPPSAKRSMLQTAGDFVGNVVDNVLPNWGDEVAGAGAWLGAKAGVNGRDPKTAFGAAQREFKDAQASYKANHPTLAKASALYGIGGSLAVPMGRVAEGASLGARALHSYAVGTGMGAVTGAGEGDNLRDRTVNALTTGAVGGLLGAAAEPLMSLAGRAGQVLRNTVPGMDAATRAVSNLPRRLMGRPLATAETDAHLRAGKLLQSRLRDGNIQTGFGQTGAAATPDAILAEVQRRQDMGVPAMAGDTTDSLRGLTGWASRGIGPGQALVRRALDERKAQEADRVRQHIAATLGDAVDPHLALDQHMAQARAAAAPGYRAAYSQPMVVTPEIEGIMQTPAFRDALPQAVRNIRNAQRDPHELGFRLDQDGNISGVHGLSTEGFDQVVRAMQDSGRAAMDTSGFTPRNTTNSVHINARAADLRQHLIDQNEPYRDAVTRYGDDMAQRDAFTAGQDVMRQTGHELNEQARRMPDATHGSWSVGARTALADEASRFGAQHPTGNTAARVRQALGDQTKQDAIGQLTGNTGAVRDLQDRLEAEHQGNILWGEVRGNSQTAQRRAADGDVEHALGSFSLTDLARPGRIGERIINRLASGATEGIRNDVKEQVARILTERDPQRLRESFQAFEAGDQRQAAREALVHQLTTMGIRVGGANLPVPNPGENQ